MDGLSAHSQSRKIEVAMQPHDDDWDLEPNHAHPNAQALLTEAFYWDCVDENTPLGNDTGADVLAGYSETLSAAPETDPLEFLTSLLEDWEMLIDDWDTVDPARVARWIEDDLATVATSDDAVIGLAFSMLIIHGFVDARIQAMALTAIGREQLSCVIAGRGWKSATQRRARLADFAAKLKAMQTV